MKKLLNILSRTVGAHLLKGPWKGLSSEEIQAKIEGLAWRGVVSGVVALYNTNDKFKHGLDQIIQAIGG